jgi:chromate transport protein ChrA
VVPDDLQQRAGRLAQRLGISLGRFYSMAAAWLLLVMPAACIGGAVLTGADHDSEVAEKGGPFLVAAFIVGVFAITAAIKRFARHLDERATADSESPGDEDPSR